MSITLTPVMAYYLLPGLKRLSQRESWLVRKLKSANHAALHFAFGHRGLLLGVTAVAVLGAGAGVFGLKRTFLPTFNEGTFTINALFNPGISLAESHRVGLIAERLILEVPEVIGRSPHRACRAGRARRRRPLLRVRRRPQAVLCGKAQIVADLRQRLAILPVAVNVGQPISIASITLSGVRAEIAVRNLR